MKLFSSSPFFCRILFIALLAGGISQPNIAVAEESSSRPLQVCLNNDGTVKRGDIDVVLLLDNSKSLNTTKSGKRGTDPNFLRFDAIRDLLVGLHEVATAESSAPGVKINFGMISFGRRATEHLPLAELTAPEETANKIRKKLPEKSQEDTTNYVVALEKAHTVLEARPEQNCKMLVWFTDGQFESEELSTTKPDYKEKVRDQADELQRNICGPAGLAERLHQLRVNTFVLVLKPSTKGPRLEASYGAMQAITGSTVIPPGITSDSDMCGNPADRDHLGDILVAEDAASIARKIPTIGNAIDGWTPATVCPVSGSSDDMPKMPAARHLKSISFTAYEKGTDVKNLDGLKVVDARGTSNSFSQFLKPLKAQSKYEKRFEFTKAADLALDQGWTFAIDGGEVGWCVQVLHRQFMVEFTDNNNEPVIDVTPGARLTSSDINRISYQLEGASTTLSLQDARNASQRVLGSLKIDPTEVIFKNPISVLVKQRNVPTLNCQEFVFSAAGADMPKDKRLTATCQINTANSTLSSVSIKAIAGEGLADDKCNAELLLAETGVDDEWTASSLQTSSTLTHEKGITNLHSVLSFSGREAKCLSANESRIQLTFGDKREVLKVPVSVDIELKKVPRKWIVIAFALAILLLVVLLNLLLMRLLMTRSAKISRSGVDAYEIPVLVRKTADGRLEVRLSDGSPPSSHVFDVAAKIALRVDTDGRSAQLNGGTRSKLKMVLPPLYRPFGEALIVIDSAKRSLYWQRSLSRRGLQPHIKAGLILHSPVRSGDNVQATATFLLPSQGEDRQSFVRDVLGARISVVLQDLLSEPDWFSGNSTASGAAPARPSSQDPSSSETPRSDGGTSDGPNTRRPPQPPPAPPPRG
jgi:hypothetical protein